MRPIFRTVEGGRSSPGTHVAGRGRLYHLRMRRRLVPCAVVALCACANPGAPGGDATLARAEAALRSGDLADALALVDRGLSVVDAARSTSAFWHLRLMRADIAITRRALDEAAPTLHAPIPTDVEYDTLRARQRILLARVQAIEGQQRQALQTLDAARPLGLSAQGARASTRWRSWQRFRRGSRRR